MPPESYCSSAVNRSACNLLAKSLKKSTELQGEAHNSEEMTEFKSRCFACITILFTVQARTVFPLGQPHSACPSELDSGWALAVERRREGLEEPALRVVEKGIYAMNG